MKKIEISVQSENVRPAGPSTEYRLRPNKVIQGREQIPLITPDLFAEVSDDYLVVTVESGDGILGKTLAAAIPVVDSSQTIFEYKPHGNAMTTARGLVHLPQIAIPSPFAEIYPDKQYTARAYRPLMITAYNGAPWINPWYLMIRPVGANIPYQKTNSSMSKLMVFLVLG
jgi:hypothetical protein